MWCLVFAGLTGWLPVAHPPAAELPRKVKPVMSWDASVGDRAKGWLGRCDSDAQWEEAWRRFHERSDREGDWSRPEIDFTAYTVVVICHDGPAAGTLLYEVAEDAERVRVRYRPGGIQTAVLANQSEADRLEQEWRLARSYTFRASFVVLPATRKPVVFEEGIGGTTLEPSEWKERARRPAGKGK